MYRKFFHIGLSLVLLIGASALATDGTLDTTFGTDGKVTTDFNDSIDYGWAVALQSNGKIVVAGASTNNNGNDFILARYNKNGSLDTTFGTDGKVITDFGSDDDECLDVVIQPDGKIVAAGAILNKGGYDFALARYNRNGTLDTTFGSDGKVTTDFNNGIDYGFAVAIQSDGRIVMAGHALITDSGDFALARYNRDGSLDTNFGIGGKVVTDFGNSDGGNAIIIQPADNKIIVAGNSSDANNLYFALGRYNADGSLDATFGSDGKVITTIGGWDSADDIALQPDGKIVAAGYGDFTDRYRDFVLVRYNNDGSLDTTFGVDGKVTTDFGEDDEGSAIVIQPDGKIVVVGAENTLSTFSLARYNSDGSLDDSFGTNGKVTTAIDSSSVANAVALQPDGNILVAGSSYNGNNLDFALARYIGTDIFKVTFKSSDSLDGWVLESAQTSNKGGSLNVTGKTFQIGDDAFNRQYKAILSFNVSLPTGAVIQSAALRIKQSGSPVGKSPFAWPASLLADVKQGSFSKIGLELNDFQALPSAKKVGTFGKTATNGWYSANLNAAGISKINTVGVTQFRLYFSKGDNNNAKADYLKFYSGNSPANKPELVITYTVP